MRPTLLAVAVALFCAAGLLAQQLPVQAPPAPIDPKLNEILGSWERVMNSINTLVVECSRTTIDKTWQRTEVFDGTAKFLKPGRASLELHSKTNPQQFEKLVVNTNELCTYAPQSKQILVYKLQADSKPGQGQGSEDNFLTFLFGGKADEAKRRYQLKLLPAPPNDKWYYYLEIMPRSPTDRADFTRARLVLTATNFLPRQLWFEQPNGNEVTWDFNKLSTGVELRPAEFERPVPPAGWQLVPGDGPATRVIRNKGQ
jgi:TIGR03009 family protein